jgi:predicted regulator of Ras-like GTPase activity (Roadblock/LC7/MglB family)
MMANKKQITQNTQSPVVVESQEKTENEASPFKDLSEKLKSIRKSKGVIGYIIRNGASASIDLEEPEKLVEYAIFTSQVIDSSQELANLFTIGDVKNVLVEGKELNVLNLIVKENKINIFLKKDVDHRKIAQKILV